MAYSKIDLPESFLFGCTIPIRITDINYGKHVGNDAVLSLLHEARMQYLHSLGYTEMNMAGCGMIMREVSIEFKKELFYPDIVTISVAAGEFSRAGFSLIYKIEKPEEGKMVLAAVARTGMICYDYERKKIVSLPEGARKRMER